MSKLKRLPGLSRSDADKRFRIQVAQEPLVAWAGRCIITFMDALRQIWKKTLFVITVVAVVVSFFTFIELIRAYQVLDELHPWIGIGYLLLLVLLALVMFAVYIKSVLTRPKILKPPAPADMPAYAKYLVNLAVRLGRNKKLTSTELHQSLQDNVLDVQHAMKAASDEELEIAVDALLSDGIEPCMEKLNGLAEREVHRCVRDVMIGVTISPWRAADLLVVFYRNMMMVTGVVRIYDVRPTVGSQVRIMIDISKIVFTVNILNYGSKLAENLASGIPFVGRFVDDIAQGAGAGLLTSMAGHSAIERCSCVQPWNQARAQARIGAKAKDFAADLKSIVAEDVLPRLKPRIQESETEVDPGRMENMKTAVSSAMDQTADAMGTFVRKPAYAAGRGMAATGRTVFTGAGKVSAAGFRGVVNVCAGAARTVRKGVKKTISLFRPRRDGK